ncbi:MAG: DNA polymerase III subunit delta [Deltaproteobacteria bacterium]|nr:DNA polymerase III subunit delta [Deltaproteobacteria bacterium]
MEWKKKPVAGAMTPSAFHKDLKAGTWKPVMVFFGKEDVLLARAEAFVVGALLGKRRNDFNFEVIYCEKGAGRAIAEAAVTTPFGGGLKLVAARNASELKEEDYQPLARFAANPPGGGCLILEYPGAGSPWGPGKAGEGKASFREALKKNGQLVEFGQLNRRELAAYIRREAHEKGITTTEDAIALLIEETGDSLAALFSALEQAALYARGKRLDSAGMKAVLIKLRGFTVFEITAALGDRKLPLALAMAEQILAAARDDLGLPYYMTMIARHFRMLIKVRDMLHRKVGAAEMSRRLGILEKFVREEYIPQARNFPAPRLAESLAIIRDADLDVRTGRLDQRRAVERLVLRLCA